MWCLLTECVPLILPDSLRQIYWQVSRQRCRRVVVFYGCAARNQSWECKQHKEDALALALRSDGKDITRLSAATPFFPSPQNSYQPHHPPPSFPSLPPPPTHPSIHPLCCTVSFSVRISQLLLLQLTLSRLGGKKKENTKLDWIVTVLHVAA